MKDSWILTQRPHGLPLPQSTTKYDSTQIQNEKRNLLSRVCHFVLGQLSSFSMRQLESDKKKSSKIFEKIISAGKDYNCSNLIGELINEQLPLKERGLVLSTYQSNEITNLIILFPGDLHLLLFRLHISQTFVLTLCVYASQQKASSCGFLKEKLAEHSPNTRAKQLENFSTLYYLLVKCYKLVNQLIYEPC